MITYKQINSKYIRINNTDSNKVYYFNTLVTRVMVSGTNVTLVDDYDNRNQITFNYALSDITYIDSNNTVQSFPNAPFSSAQVLADDLISVFFLDNDSNVPLDNKVYKTIDIFPGLYLSTDHITIVRSNNSSITLSSTDKISRTAYSDLVLSNYSYCRKTRTNELAINNPTDNIANTVRNIRINTNNLSGHLYNYDVLQSSNSIYFSPYYVNEFTQIEFIAGTSMNDTTFTPTNRRYVAFFGLLSIGDIAGNTMSKIGFAIRTDNNNIGVPESPLLTNPNTLYAVYDFSVGALNGITVEGGPLLHAEQVYATPNNDEGSNQSGFSNKFYHLVLTINHFVESGIVKTRVKWYVNSDLILERVFHDNDPNTNFIYNKQRNLNNPERFPICYGLQQLPNSGTGNEGPANINLSYLGIKTNIL